MSWKFADWRWREQASLRERPLWKIGDFEDVVKNGDVVKEAVRLACHFSEQVDGCWQSRIELPCGGRIGSIRSGTNPYPPPGSDLPDLPQQHHTLYHPSQASCVPLLASSEKTSLRVEDFISPASSLSSLPSKSIGSTPCASAPGAPQQPTDFLDSRDWNHLALDQEIERRAAVSQLQSSFDHFSKSAYIKHSRRPRFGPQYRILETINTSVESRVSNYPLRNRQLYERHKSAQSIDTSPAYSQDRIIPWSILDTVFEEQQYFSGHQFQSQSICGPLNLNQSLVERSALLAEISSGDKSELYCSSHDSASSLLPRENMGRFTFGKSNEDDENKTSKPNRNNPHSTKIFPDLSSAHSEIVGKSGGLGEFVVQEIPSFSHLHHKSSETGEIHQMRNLTGGTTNLPALTDLPKTPIRPGAAAPAIQKQLAEARAMRERSQVSNTPERPPRPLLPETPNVQLITPLQHRALLRRDDPENDKVLGGELVSRSRQIRELSDMASHESGLAQKTLVRNSLSIFDLAGDHRRVAEETIHRLNPCFQDDNVSTTSSSVDKVVEMYTASERPRSWSVPVRGSLNIIDIATAADEGCVRHTAEYGEPPMTAPLPNRRGALAGKPPQVGLPILPQNLFHRQETTPPSSEAAQYRNTQSLLSAGRYDQHTDMAEDLETQLSRSRGESEAAELQEVCESPATPPLHKLRAQPYHDADASGGFGCELARCGPREPEYPGSSLSPFSADSFAFGLPATAPYMYHNVLRATQNPINPIPGCSPSQEDKEALGESVGCDWMSSQVSEDDDVSELALIGSSEKTHGNAEAPGTAIQHYRRIRSAEWFAGLGKKEGEMEGKKTSQGLEEDRDWETIQSSGMSSDMPSRATLQPPFESQLGALDTTDRSLADTFMTGTFSTGEMLPATPWDPLPKDKSRVHPALPGTLHKQRLRTDTTTGKQVWVPEYSLPEIGPQSSSSDPFDSAQTAFDLPTAYPPVSRFSTSTPRQQAFGDDTSSEKRHPSSPDLFRGQTKAQMATARQGQDTAQGRVVHELEGYQVEIVAGDHVVKRLSTIENTGTMEASLKFGNAMKQHSNLRDDEIVKRFSTMNDDGSYYEVDKEASSDYGILGGTGIRVTGRSTVNISSDVDGHLASGLMSDPITDTRTPRITMIPQVLTREQVEAAIRNNGGNARALLWGNVQRDITGVTFPSGHTISAPRAFQILRTLPPVNSFALTKNEPIIVGTMAEAEIAERIVMSIDDWARLQTNCPQFPLRDAHLTMKFTEKDARRTGDNIYNRGGISRITGKIEEDGYCFEHKMREFSTLPSLRRLPLPDESLRLQKSAGRRVVKKCVFIPVLGWILLYYVWKQDPTINVSRDLMLWHTNNAVGEMGEEEIELAGRALLWGTVGAFGLLLACLGVLLWAFL